MGQHRMDYRKWKAGEKPYMSSFDVLDEGDAYIELLEEFSCDSKERLTKREGELVRSMTCVNRNIPGRSRDEWVEANPNYWIQWREEHPEYFTQWREKNRDKINERRRERYAAEKAKRLVVAVAPASPPPLEETAVN